MTREEFDRQYKSKRITCGLQIPRGDNFFYACDLCGDVLPSSPTQNDYCSCGNLFVWAEWGGRVGTETLHTLSVLEVYE